MDSSYIDNIVDATRKEIPSVIDEYRFKDVNKRKILSALEEGTVNGGVIDEYNSNDISIINMTWLQILYGKDITLNTYVERFSSFINTNNISRLSSIQKCMVLQIQAYLYLFKPHLYNEINPLWPKNLERTQILTSDFIDCSILHSVLYDPNHSKKGQTDDIDSLGGENKQARLRSDEKGLLSEQIIVGYRLQNMMRDSFNGHPYSIILEKQKTSDNNINMKVSKCINYILQFKHFNRQAYIVQYKNLNTNRDVYQRILNDILEIHIQQV